MNNKWKIAGAIAALAAILTFAVVTPTFAQSLSQPDDFTPPGQNQAQNGPGGGNGYMAVDQATLHAAIAEALGISITDFEAALAQGKTPAILAQELGIDFTLVLEAMDAVHAEALQEAVASGLITQEQADWILSHRGGQNGQGNGLMGNGMNQGNGYGQGNGGYGQGNGFGNGGMQGQGGGGNFGNNGNGGTCPYQS